MSAPTTEKPEAGLEEVASAPVSTTTRRRAPLFLLGWAAMVAVVLLMPEWLPETGFLTLSDGIFAAFLTTVTIGLVLVMGYAGQISLGQNALYGLGAYGSAILTAKYGWNPWLGMVVSAVFAAVVALIVGITTFRLRGHFLAMATLGLGIIRFSNSHEAAIAGGANGLGGVPK